MLQAIIEIRCFLKFEFLFFSFDIDTVVVPLLLKQDSRLTSSSKDKFVQVNFIIFYL